MKNFTIVWLLINVAGVSIAQNKPVAVGDPAAKKGGSLTMRLESYPKSMNPFTATDSYASAISRHVFCYLGTSDYETWKLIPYAAERWQLSEDKLSIDFFINPKARWDDGSPVTADDLVFTYDTIFNKKYNTASQRSWLDAVKSWKKISPRQFHIQFNRPHYENVVRVADLNILQKSYYEKKNFAKDLNHHVQGCGPYKIDKKKSKKNRYVTVTRKKDWWGYSLQSFAKAYNFDRIRYSVIKDDRVSFEQFKKGKLGWYEFRLAGLDFWGTETEGPLFKKGSLRAFSIPRANPAEWAGIGLNLRRHPTNELKFRQLLQAMFNTQLYTKKIFRSLYLPIKGPFGLFSDASSPRLKPPTYDMNRAKKLLAELGYKTADKDGILYRQGKTGKERAEITIMYSNLAHEKYLTIYKEDARKIGVAIHMKFVEWATAMKQLDDWTFQAFILSWVGAPNPSPSQHWLSKYADQKSSSNFPGFKNALADKLIHQAGSEFDRDKRNKLYHQLEEIIVNQQPYIWRWSQSHHYMAYNKDLIKKPEKDYKYSGTANRKPPYIYWWDARVK